MTLHFYMHWFWITTYTYVICIPTTNPAEDLTTIPPNGSEYTTVTEPMIKVTKAISSLDNIPASTNIPTEASISVKKPKDSLPKMYKPSTKKPINSGSLLNRTTATTPIIKETTVIDVNATDLNVTLENQTFVSVRLNSSNRTDNVTFLVNENSNKSLIPNSELIGKEDEQVISDNLSAAGITGITLGCVSFVAIIITVSFFIYRNRGLNRPQVLNDHCSNIDSSGYIDDASVRENSEEMYSLDNDSFLNSLEAMTIQNYWTDTVRHTKL